MPWYLIACVLNLTRCMFSIPEPWDILYSFFFIYMTYYIRLDVWIFFLKLLCIKLNKSAHMYESTLSFVGVSLLGKSSPEDMVARLVILFLA